MSEQPDDNKDRQIETLRKRLDTWKQSAKQQLEDAQKKNESLRRQLESITAERDSLRSKEEDRSVACDALVARAVSLQEKLSSSEAKLHEEKVNLATIKSQHSEQVNSLEIQISELRKQLEELTSTTLAAASSSSNRITGDRNDNHEDNRNTTGSTRSGKKRKRTTTNSSSDDGFDDDIDSINDEDDGVATDHNDEYKKQKTKIDRKIALLQQQLEDRDCRIAVLNSLYSQAKTEATNASSLISSIRDDHSNVVDQLRSSIATMTVQVASKSSALESVKRQLEETKNRATWFEEEVQRLRDDGAERERAYDSLMKQFEEVEQQQQQHKTKNNISHHHRKFYSSSKDGNDDSSFDNLVDDENNNNNNNNNNRRRNSNSSPSSDFSIIVEEEDNTNHNNRTTSSLEKQIQTLKENLEIANSSMNTKDTRCRHLETRIEEQQVMVRNLAKQLSDQSFNGNTVSGSSSSSAGAKSNSSLLDNFDETSTSSIGASSSPSSSYTAQQQQHLRRWLDYFVLQIDSTKLQLNRLFQKYKVLAPMVLGVMVLVFFMIWFSRGSGPATNKVGMFAQRTEQLEAELAAVREAYGKLSTKCGV